MKFPQSLTMRFTTRIFAAYSKELNFKLISIKNTGNLLTKKTFMFKIPLKETMRHE